MRLDCSPDYLAPSITTHEARKPFQRKDGLRGNRLDPKTLQLRSPRQSGTPDPGRKMCDAALTHSTIICTI